MSGSKILLNALGKQDDYLSKNPEYSFFKTGYLRHTNFAKSLLALDPDAKFNRKVDFGETLIFQIEKVSDLLLSTTIEFNLSGCDWPNSNRTVPETIYALIDRIELVVGNKVLQNLSGDWLYIDNTLKHSTDNRNIAAMAYASKFNQIDPCKNNYKLHYVLPFFFMRNPGLALPLWALQNESIEIRIKLRKRQCITDSKSNSIETVKLLCEFVELEEDEKRKFKDLSLEYLIEQVNFCGSQTIEAKNSSRKKIKIETDPLVNEIIWAFRDNNKNYETYFNFWLNNSLDNDHSKVTNILLNGRTLNPRFSASYYRKIQKYQNYDGCRNVYNVDLDENNNINKNCIYNYSFSLNPSKINPSGILSLDKFNSVEIDIQLLGAENSRDLMVFIKKFNLIRIKDGYLNILTN